MSFSYSQSRNVELSTMDYLKTNLAIDWPGVTLAKTWAQVYAKDIALPIVNVRLSDTQTVYREIGDTVLEDRYLIIVDIFSTSDGQRLDLSYYVKDKLRQTWPCNDYTNSGAGVLSTVADGNCIITQFISDQRVDFSETVDTKDRYRQTLSFRVRKSLTTT